MTTKNSALKNLILPGIIGNVLEWFEFSLYGYFASIFAELFFPSHNFLISLLQTFAVFAAGFLVRPLGAIIFGHLGDKFGRRKTLSLSILLMAIPTTLIGLLPTHQQIGVWAGILLLLFRLIQGLAIGGELGGTIVYVVEQAPAGQRGLYACWTKFGLFLGIFLGSGTAAIMGHFFNAAALNQWAWRIPFLAGIPLGIVGYYLRHNLPETPYFLALQQEQKIQSAPLVQAFKQAGGKMLTGFLLMMLATLSFYLLFVFLPTYTKKYANLSFAYAMTANTISMAVAVILLPISGWISDRIGRRPQLILGSLGFIIFSYPMFVMLTKANTVWGALLPQIVLTILLVPVCGVTTAVLAEIFPTQIRYSASSFSINLATAIFGGTAPLVATFLINITHIPAAPSFYLILASIISLFTVIFMPETFQRNL